MKINYALISRILIALLFVVAGVQMAMDFKGASGFIGSLMGVSGTSFSILAIVVTVLVIIIHIPVALSFAWGYRVCLTGWTLIAFTFLTTVLVHRDFNVGLNLVMTLKNIAVMGGILAVLGGCSCGKCPVDVKSA